MLMSDSTRSGMVFRIAAKAVATVMGDVDFITALGQFLGDQGRGLAIVFDAENFFARFGHWLGRLLGARRRVIDA